MNLLSVTHLAKKIGNAFIVKDVNFSLQTSQRIAIAGETGSGKSTLLKMIAGLVQPDKGSILFEGERVKGPEEVLVPGHPAIAYLSQLFELPKFLRVEQVLEYANTLSDKQAAKLFKVCHIQHLLKRKTDALSGGERQRVALARQLLSQPKLLLLDEPYSNLDMLNKNTLKEVIDGLIREVGITCILVSHDPLDTLSFADELLILRRGKVIQQGSAAVIYKKPIDEYVAGLTGRYTILTTKVMKNLTGKSSRKDVLVRPEQLAVSINRKKQCVPATVQKVFYYGSYSELLVRTADQSIYVRDQDHLFSIGQFVFLHLQ
jgi:iron(III) transport system ATP-binding protein